MNILTFVVAVWLAVIALAVSIDFGPEIYREKRAHTQLVKTCTRLAEQKAATPTFDPDETFQLGIFKIEKTEPAKRRHARV